jgi:hypothetical protein
LVRNIDCLRELKDKIVGEKIATSAQTGRAVRLAKVAWVGKWKEQPKLQLLWAGRRREEWKTRTCEEIEGPRRLNVSPESLPAKNRFQHRVCKSKQLIK